MQKSIDSVLKNTGIAYNSLDGLVGDKESYVPSGSELINKNESEGYQSLIDDYKFIFDDLVLEDDLTVYHFIPNTNYEHKFMDSLSNNKFDRYPDINVYYAENIRMVLGYELINEEMEVDPVYVIPISLIDTFNEIIKDDFAESKLDNSQRPIVLSKDTGTVLDKDIEEQLSNSDNHRGLYSRLNKFDGKNYTLEHILRLRGYNDLDIDEIFSNLRTNTTRRFSDSDYQ